MERIKTWLLLLGGIFTAFLYGLFRREQHKRIVAESDKAQADFNNKKENLEKEYEKAKTEADRLAADYEQSKSRADQ